MDNEVKIHERIATLETKVDAVMNNHLPHIQNKVNDIGKQVEKVDNRTWWILGTLILGFITTIVITLIKNYV